MRIDKWLWTMRFFKTRTLATDYCNRGRVKINNSLSKPSREVKSHDVIEVDLKSYIRTCKILKINPNRIPAKLLPEFIEDLTPKSEYERRGKIEKLKLYYLDEKPSKKDRRDFENED
jgi:ribosome-associated heat shock protein Hsp15